MKYSEDSLEFSTTHSKHKHETNSAKEWLDTLKLYWKVSETTMIDNETDIIVIHYGRTVNLFVAYYNKETKKGYIYDRRGKVR